MKFHKMKAEGYAISPEMLNALMLHQYATLMDDLIEIALFNHQTSETEDPSFY